MKVPAGISAQATAPSTRRAAQSAAVPEDFSGAHLTRTRMALTLGALTLLALLSAIVAATFNEMSAPTKLSTEESAIAVRGESARVEIVAATAFAVSWKPFVKSNPSAARTTITSRAVLCI